MMDPSEREMFLVEWLMDGMEEEAAQSMLFAEEADAMLFFTAVKTAFGFKRGRMNVQYLSGDEVVDMELLASFPDKADDE